MYRKPKLKPRLIVYANEKALIKQKNTDIVTIDLNLC